MRPRLLRATTVATTGVVALLCLATAGAAQVLVTADRPLEFGLLTPGVPMVVSPTDVPRRAAYTIATRGRYTLTFQLPTHLTEPGGGVIPVEFGAGDGRVEIRNRTITFDPDAGVNIHINPADTDARIYLGGTARPAPGTPAGSYSATIVMMVIPTGT